MIKSKLKKRKMCKCGLVATCYLFAKPYCPECRKKVKRNLNPAWNKNYKRFL